MLRRLSITSGSLNLTLSFQFMTNTFFEPCSTLFFLEAALAEVGQKMVIALVFAN